MLRRRMIETQTRCRMEWLSSISDKATRARGFQSRAAMGEVSLRDDEMGERVLKQLLTFPAGKHDDAVDVCGMIGRALDEAHPAIVPVEDGTRTLNASELPVPRIMREAIVAGMPQYLKARAPDAETQEFEGRGIEIYKEVGSPRRRRARQGAVLSHRDRDWYDNLQR
jgi:hypothetical protein